MIWLPCQGISVRIDWQVRAAYGAELPIFYRCNRCSCRDYLQ